MNILQQKHVPILWDSMYVATNSRSRFTMSRVRKKLQSDRKYGAWVSV